MRYHRSDVIRMTSSSVPERIFFLSRSISYVIAYCYVNQQHSDRLVSGINCDGVSFGDSFSVVAVEVDSKLYRSRWPGDYGVPLEALARVVVEANDRKIVDLIGHYLYGGLVL